MTATCDESHWCIGFDTQDVAKSLREVLEYDGDIENDLCLTFQASFGQNGRVITEDLVQGLISSKISRHIAGQATASE